MQIDAKNARLLIDTNVWVGYFTRDERTCRACEELLETAIAHDVTLLVSPTTLKDVFYLIPRCFRRQDMAEGKPAGTYVPAAWGCLEFMLEIATPSPISLAECSMARAFKKRFGDFEDSLILASGETAGADYIVTYDKPLLQAFPEIFVTPERAIELLDIALS